MVVPREVPERGAVFKADPLLHDRERREERVKTRRREDTELRPPRCLSEPE